MKPRHLNPQQRRALELLANLPHGAAEGLMLAHGFRRDTLAGLVLAGLATVVTEIVEAGGGPTIKVERYRITAAGHRALESG